MSPTVIESCQDNGLVRFSSLGLQYSIVRPGTLTNDSPRNDCARAQIKQAWGISRADVAKTLKSLDDNTAQNTTFEIIKETSRFKEALEKIS
jgi:hypothetical protein